MRFTLQFLFILYSILFGLGCVPSTASNSNHNNNSNTVPYLSSNGPYSITTIYTTLTDASRSWDDNGITVPNREIPIKVYTPDAANSGPFPLLLMSSPLGGDVESTSYMGEYLAAYGYIVIVVQHHGSDSQYLIDHGNTALITSASKPATRLLRPQDMSFVLDKVFAETTGLALLTKVRIDLTKIGVLGHSFGAWTALSCLGQTFDGGTDLSDCRFLCGTAYSPQAPPTLGLENISWDNLTKPTLTLGGTDDTSPGTTNPNDRHVPFDKMPGTNTKYHGTLQGATHSDFEDNGDHGVFYHDWIQQMTIAFFDAYLQNNIKAKSWLDAKSITKLTDYVIQENK